MNQIIKEYKTQSDQLSLGSCQNSVQKIEEYLKASVWGEIRQKSELSKSGGRIHDWRVLSL